jgi:hypothetical protein
VEATCHHAGRHVLGHGHRPRDAPGPARQVRAAELFRRAGGTFTFAQPGKCFSAAAEKASTTSCVHLRNQWGSQGGGANLATIRSYVTLISCVRHRGMQCNGSYTTRSIDGRMPW